MDQIASLQLYIYLFFIYAVQIHAQLALIITPDYSELFLKSPNVDESEAVGRFSTMVRIRYKKYDGVFTQNTIRFFVRKVTCETTK